MLRLLRAPGSSIAAPSAAGWVSDFLNAAYFARHPAARDIDDLRLAAAILTTRWAGGRGGRLGASDVLAFHRAFGLRRLRGHPRGTLDRNALLAGAATLIGPWFTEAYGDPARRAHGVVFPTAAQREAFDPAQRLRHARLGPLTAPETERHTHTYPPVPLPAPERAEALLLDPARWPDIAAEGGRFTALRRGGLPGNTFEIEVNAQAAPRLPVYTRAYVTCTGVHRRGTPELQGYAAGLPGALPAGAEPLLAIELTTHAGHFLGRALSRLVVFATEDGAWVRDVGSWDPLPWYLEQAYERVGRRAQAAFWGPAPEAGSMLAQLAKVSAA